MNIYLLGKKSNQLIYKILSLKTCCDRLILPKTINNINYMYGGGMQPVDLHLCRKEKFI